MTHVIWYILSQSVTNIHISCTFHTFKIVEVHNIFFRKRGIMAAAAAPDSLEEILSCQVCFEEFEEDGAHVPRILPCSHTLCHTCVGRLIRGERLECPECRMKHEAKKEEKSFPRNKYVLVQMSRRTSKLGRAQPDKCREHGKVLNIFCKEPECQKIICFICLSRDHKKHEVINAEERIIEVTDILQKNIKAATNNLQRKIRIIMAAKEDAEKNVERNLNELKIKKQYMMKKYDEMIKDSEDQMKEINIKTDQDINAMKETLNLLHEVKSVEAIGGDRYTDTMNKVDTVSGIIENVNKHQTGTRTYHYHEYTTNIRTQLNKKQISVEIKEEITDSNLKTNLPFCDEMTTFSQTIIKPARLQGKTHITYS